MKVIFVHLLRLDLVPVLVLGVHGHELEQHQVEDGGDDGEAEQDEEEGEEDVEGLVLQGLVLLQGNKVTETWGEVHFRLVTFTNCHCGVTQVALESYRGVTQVRRESNRCVKGELSDSY